MAKYYVDYVGLNTFIYETVGYDSDNQTEAVAQNTLGLTSGDNTGLSNYKNLLFSHNLPTTASFFPALILKRNGPYGFPTWKQTRVSENPLSRKQRKENVFTLVTEPGPEVLMNNDGRLNMVRGKYGEIQKFIENSVYSHSKPFILGAGSFNPDGEIERFELVGTYGNETQFFNNDRVNKYYAKQMDRSNQYEMVKNLYIDGLDEDGSPIDSFEYLKYRECIYPPRVYKYKNYVRQRTTFDFPWRDDRDERITSGDRYKFGDLHAVYSNYDVISSSMWPLDANSDFETWNYGTNKVRFYRSANSTLTKDFGILQNTYTSFSYDGDDSDLDYFFSPLYARKHMIVHSESLVSPSGMQIEGVNFGTTLDLELYDLPCGEAKWDAASQSGLKPFYNSYNDYIEGARQYGKDYTVIPEFRISDHVETYHVKGTQEQITDLFSVTGGLSGQEDSSKDNFYEIYSNSDFMKHFEVVKRDHKDFVTPTSITLKCKAVKKLLPYDGFYPAQRTVELARQFVSSYRDNVSSVINPLGSWRDDSTAIQNLIQPLFAPGVLYNSIKSGVACDYATIADSGSGTVIAVRAAGAINLPAPSASDGYHYNSTTSSDGFSYGKFTQYNDVISPQFYAFTIRVPSGSLLDTGAVNGTQDRAFRFVSSSAGYFNGQVFTTSSISGLYVAVNVDSGATWQNVVDNLSSSIAHALSGTIIAEITNDGITLQQAPGALGNIPETGGGFGNPTELVPSFFEDLHDYGRTGTEFDPQITFTTFNGGADEFYSFNNDNGSLSGSIFDARIPFEALVEPETFLADTNLFCLESHPSGSVDTIANWNGQGDVLYKLMVNNFLAEVGSFFMKNGEYSTIVSKPSSDPSFGNAEAGKTYRMRVHLYKTTNNRVPTQLSASSTFRESYFLPQYTDDSQETFTMYSRPTAFGPDVLFSNSSRIVGIASSNGENYCHTPPYYNGDSWADISFTPAETKKYTVNEIINSSSVSYYRWLAPGTRPGELPSDEGGQSGNQQLNTVVNKNAMQLDSSLNLFQLTREFATGDSITVDSNDPPARWAIQTKFETPTLNFNHLTSSTDVSQLSGTIKSIPVARGMWHQYGLLEENPRKGIFMQVTDIPFNFHENILGEDRLERYSLKSLCGFSSDPVRIGDVADTKKISEAVVAIPFIEEDGERKFFRIPRIDINRASGDDADRALVGESVLNMIAKMQRYVFPPTMDFLMNPSIDPFAMYIFEFSHVLKKQDLANIWQNLYPEITQTFETAESSITHDLLAHELIGGGAVVTPQGTLDVNNVGNEIPNRVRWMVFKVKQKAETSYYKKIIGRRDELSEASVNSEGLSTRVSYNWPYDFFSLVELAKIEAEVEFSERQIKPDQEPFKTVSPKVSQRKQATRTTTQGIRESGRQAGREIRQQRLNNTFGSRAPILSGDEE